jgi:hypothetical protein
MDRALALSPDSPAESARRGARDQRPYEPGGWLGAVLRGSDRNLGPGQTGFSNPVHGRAGVYLDPESIGGIPPGRSCQKIRRPTRGERQTRRAMVEMTVRFAPPDRLERSWLRQARSRPPSQCFPPQGEGFPERTMAQCRYSLDCCKLFARGAAVGVARRPSDTPAFPWNSLIIDNF